MDYGSNHSANGPPQPQNGQFQQNNDQQQRQTMQVPMEQEHFQGIDVDYSPYITQNTMQQMHMDFGGDYGVPQGGNQNNNFAARMMQNVSEHQYATGLPSRSHHDHYYSANRSQDVALSNNVDPSNNQRRVEALQSHLQHNSQQQAAFQHGAFAMNQNMDIDPAYANHSMHFQNAGGQTYPNVNVNVNVPQPAMVTSQRSQLSPLPNIGPNTTAGTAAAAAVRISTKPPESAGVSVASVAPTTNSHTTAKPDQMFAPPESAGAVLASEPKTKVHQPESLKRAPTQLGKSPRESKRKKTQKPLKKIMMGKKEMDQANRLLDGKIDLLDVLPRDDCFFLASSMWIHTLSQLSWILGIVSHGTDKEGARREKLQQELVQRLQSSSLFKVEDLSDENTGPAGSAAEIAVDKPEHDGTDITGDSQSSAKDGGSSLISQHNNAELNKLSAQPSGERTILGDENEMKNIGNTAVRLDDKSKTREKLNEWMKLVQEYQHRELTVANSRTQFPLDGPLSHLFPPYACNFFSSINFKCAHDFLEVKKTETGRIVDMLAIWRRKCEMPKLPPISLAKHLLGLSFRIETALGSKEVVDQFTREWAGGSLVVLSGAGREFIIHEQKLIDGKIFADMQTKILADALVDWRIQRGMPTLKGTGKVAMISSWKAVVKEALDVEAHDGKVISGVNFEKEAEGEENVAKGDTSKPIKPRKQEPKVQVEVQAPAKSTSVQPTLKTPVTTLQGVCHEKYVAAMAAIGITTRQHLLDARKNPASTLVNAIMEVQHRTDDKAYDLATCTQMIDKWCLAFNTSTKTAKEPSARKDTAPPEEPENAEKSSKRHNIPFDTLSTVAKSFLGTLGIQSAEEFLSTRTTDIAKSFVAWRGKMSMPVLKGLGAIASVSGWKAQVRKAAKNVGMSTVAELTPSSARNSAEKKSAPQLTPLDRREKITKFSKPAMKEAVDKRVLFGMPRRRIAVASAQRKYMFELSVRRSSTDVGTSSIYITYNGSDISSSQTKDLAGLDSRVLSCSRLPVLRDCPADTALSTQGKIPYSSFLPGSGTIELGRHGVHQHPVKEGCGDIIKVLAAFIDTNTSIHDDVNVKADTDSMDIETRAEGSQKMQYWNVFERVSQHGERHCFLCVKDPIEKGQTVELRFLPSDPSSMVEGDMDFDTKQRLWIQERISQLPLNDLRSLLDHVQESIGTKIYAACEQILDISTTVPTLWIKRILIARRRMHWVTSRINTHLSQLLKSTADDVDQVLPHVAIAPLWKVELVKKLVARSVWKSGDDLNLALKNEAKREIHADMCLKSFSAFFSSRQVWCKVAEDLFNKSVELMSQFLIELDAFHDDENICSTLCDMVSASTERIERGDPADLAMDFRSTVQHCSFAIPRSAQAAGSAPTSAYREALLLCGEPQLAIQDEQADRVVATFDPTKTESANSSPTMVPISNVKSSEGDIDKKWYIERQVVAVALLVATCSLHHLSCNLKDKILLGLSEKIVESATLASNRQDLVAVDTTTRTDEQVETVAIPPVLADAPPIYEPTSLPFFLGLIWPVLKKSGWRLEAEGVASDVSFIAPGRKKGGNSRAKLLKQEAAKTRLKMANKAKELGLRYVPKRSKRLFVNAAEDLSASHGGLISQSVFDVLQRFHFSLQTSFADNDVDSLTRTQQIIDQLVECFNALAPNIFYKGERDSVEISSLQRPCDAYGCEYLMRFILVLPNVLHQSGLSTRELSDTVALIRELVDFIAVNHDDIFDESFHVPSEKYVGESIIPSFVVPQLLKMKKVPDDENVQTSSTSSTSDDLSEVVRAADRKTMTKFAASVMDQVAVCRATEEDVVKKSRRTHVGFPGLVCKHCMGLSGEGKLFFSTLESFSTATTSVEKHLGRCTKVSREVVNEIAGHKVWHKEQLKETPTGAQSAFFAQLWERMRKSDATFGQNGNGYVSLEGPSGGNLASKTPQENPDGADQDGKYTKEFTCHIALVEFLKNTSPWMEKVEVIEAVDRYYNCLDYGGRIAHTSAMPLHFSAEWLLSKVAPNPKRP